MTNKFNLAIIIIVIQISIIPLFVRASEMENIELKDQEAKDGDAELVFDADAAINKAEAKSALADMHGVFVFRDAFIAQEQVVKEAEHNERQQMEKMVLTSEKAISYMEMVDFVLMADTDSFIKDVYGESEGNSLSLWIYCGMVSICLICVKIMIDDYLKEKRKQQGKHDINKGIRDGFDIETK